MFGEIILTCNDVWKIILASIASFGGIAGLIVVCIKISVNIIAERLQKKYELQLSEKLEKLRYGLEKKNYISKVKFDKAFIIYQELSEKVMNMVYDNIKLFPLHDEIPKAEDERQKFFIERCENAIQSYNAASRALNTNAPFILKEIYNQFNNLAIQCRQQISFHKLLVINHRSNEASQYLSDEHDKCFERNEEISDKLEEIISKMREYLDSLDVLE